MFFFCATWDGNKVNSDQICNRGGENNNGVRFIGTCAGMSYCGFEGSLWENIRMHVVWFRLVFVVYFVIWQSFVCACAVTLNITSITLCSLEFLCFSQLRWYFSNYLQNVWDRMELLRYILIAKSVTFLSEINHYRFIFFTNLQNFSWYE